MNASCEGVAYFKYIVLICIVAIHHAASLDGVSLIVVAIILQQVIEMTMNFTFV